MATNAGRSDTSPTKNNVQQQQEQRQSPTPIFSQRSAKQLGLFFAGAGFLLMSTMITRRAVARRRLAAMPKFYDHANSPSVTTPSKAEGSMIAFEALNLATLNVVSFMMMASGGMAWAFDISSVDELRQKARKSLYGLEGKTDEAAEKEVEEWMAKTLSRIRREKPADEQETESERRK